MGVLSVYGLQCRVKVATIYALIDPRDRSPFYVGVTTRPLYMRMSSHVHDSITLKMNGPRYAVMQSINEAGFRTEIIDLEEVPVEQWIEAEQFWIANLKAWGAILTNTSSGGPGATGVKQTDESNQLRRKRAEGRDLSHLHTPEVRARASAATSITLTGRKATPEAILSMSLAKRGEKHNFYGKPRPPEAIAKMLETRANAPRTAAQNSPKGRIIVVDGITYDSCERASAALGVPYHRIRYLLRTGKASFLDLDSKRSLVPSKLKPLKGRPMAEKNHNSRPVIVDGIRYWGVKAAASALCHGNATIHRWLRNGRAKYAE